MEPKKKKKKFYDDYYKINYKGQTHTIPKGPITQARKHQPKKKKEPGSKRHRENNLTLVPCSLWCRQQRVCVGSGLVCLRARSLLCGGPAPPRARALPPKQPRPGTRRQRSQTSAAARFHHRPPFLRLATTTLRCSTPFFRTTIGRNYKMKSQQRLAAKIASSWCPRAPRPSMGDRYPQVRRRFVECPFFSCSWPTHNGSYAVSRWPATGPISAATTSRHGILFPWDGKPRQP